MRRVLVVANQTLGGKDLLNAIASPMEHEACQFQDHESGIAAAHERLD